MDNALQIQAMASQSRCPHGEPAPAIEPPSDDIERALLESWLNGSGRSDDAWAEKLLGRKDTTQEV